MRISDWSSDVCSSDLPQLHFKRAQAASHWLGTAETLREQIAASLLTSDAQSEVVPHKANADADEAFRDEVASWMREHLGGRFAELRHRGGPGAEEAFTDLRKQWESELAAGERMGCG